MRAETATRPWGIILRSVFLALLTTSIFAVGARILFFGLPHDVAVLFQSVSQTAAAAAAVDSPFIYDFKIRSVLMEADSPDESSSQYWWLASGAKFVIDGDKGFTAQGALPTLDRWRIRYSFFSSTDTENGHAPQNLFRLFTRSTWDDVRVESAFRIKRSNFTESENRNDSNGLFLITRYKDDSNLYYAGVRVDGNAVIKKKSNGKQYTMAEEKVFGGEYVRNNDMSLLPHNEWVSLRTEAITATNGNVILKLFMKKSDETKWTELLRATDDGKKYASTTPITGSYPIGVRTDFMDVEFDNFKAEEL